MVTQVDISDDFDSVTEESPATERVLITSEHRNFLTKQAISPEIADQFCRSVDRGWAREYFPRPLVISSGIAFRWPVPGRDDILQFRPDNPKPDKEGRPQKYVFRKGCGSFVGIFREPEDDAPIVLCEGSKQTLALLSWAPPEWGVAGVPGCQNWRGFDLDWCEDHRIVLLFDKDVATNRYVHDAATEIREALLDAGAESVRYARFAGAGTTDGVDDVLGRKAPDKRTKYLVRVIGRATDKLGRAPKIKKSGPAAQFFEDGSLLALTLANAALDKYPAALAAGNIALYQQTGVYRIDPLAFSSVISNLLGEEHRPVHLAAAEQVAKGRLWQDGKIIPDRMGAPLLNVTNGMLNLLTGEICEHDPKYLSRNQSPVAWDPNATCPRYEAWLKEVIPDQIDDLEETVSMMLDQSRTPPKALFAYGPSKSGKSTFLRIAEAIAGEENTSAISLHDLSDDKFAAAGAYGKMLNSSADLSYRDIKDISLFKMMTGGDAVEAQHKYGQRFKFWSTAMFAFSANTIPHVSESSKAYVNRIKPFKFPNSFEGHEDQAVEDRIMEELPGILARWVRAWQRLTARGEYLPTNAVVAAEFAERSDRVNRWLSLYCTIVPLGQRTSLPREEGSTATELHKAFREIQSRDGGSDMGRESFVEKLKNIPGVVTTRIGPNRAVGYNVIFHGAAEGEGRDDGLLRELQVRGVRVIDRPASGPVQDHGRSGRSSPTPTIALTEQEEESTKAMEEESKRYIEEGPETVQSVHDLESVPQPRSESAPTTEPPTVPEMLIVPADGCQLCARIREGCSLHPRDPRTVAWDANAGVYLPTNG